MNKLQRCFGFSGLSYSLASMIRVLEDIEVKLCLWLQDNIGKNDEEEIKRIQDGEEEKYNHNITNKRGKKIWKKVVVQALKENKNRKKQKARLSIQEENLMTDGEGKEQNGFSNNVVEELERCDPLKLVNVLWKRLKSTRDRLKFCIENLRTHLPTSFLPLEMMKNMNRALNLLTSLETSLCSVEFPNKGLNLKQISNECQDASGRFDCYMKLRNEVKE